MEKELDKENELYNALSEVLIKQIITLMEKLDHQIDRQGAENIITNIGLYLANKSNKIILK